jgi:hypothetical protein
MKVNELFKMYAHALHTGNLMRQFETTSGDENLTKQFYRDYSYLMEASTTLGGCLVEHLSGGLDKMSSLDKDESEVILPENLVPMIQNAYKLVQKNHAQVELAAMGRQTVEQLLKAAEALGKGLKEEIQVINNLEKDFKDFN